MLPMLRFTRPALLANDFLRNNFFGDLLDSESNLNNPAVNISEGTECYVIEVAAPGLAKSDFKINLDHNVLTISSSKENIKEDKTGNYTRQEFSYSSFARSFTLPESTETDKISASCKDGILYVSIPKKEEAKVKPAREISVA
jgi:HSP20 family protein